MTRLRIGVLVPPTHSWDDAVAIARDLERLGFHQLWVYDHLLWRRYADRPWHATYPWLAGIAAATSRIRLGTMVSNLNLHHPFVLAKSAMTIDHISSGRFTLGLGAAGTGLDATVLGQRPLTPGERVERLGEAVDVVDRLLRGQTVQFSGDHFRLDDARVRPDCVQRPRLPIAIAAGRPRSLRLAARYGDAWITYGDTSHRDTTAIGTARIVADQARRLDEFCTEIGRDPTEIARIYLAGNTDERPLAGIEAFEDFAGRYRELGFTDLVIHMPQPDDPAWRADPDMLSEIAYRYLETGPG